MARLSHGAATSISSETKPQGLYRDVLWDRSVIEMNVRTQARQSCGGYLTLGLATRSAFMELERMRGKPLQVRVFTKAQQVKGCCSTNKSLAKRRSPMQINISPHSMCLMHLARSLPWQSTTAQRQVAARSSPQALLILFVSSSTAMRFMPTANDLAFIKIEMVDAHGNVVPTDASQWKYPSRLWRDGCIRQCRPHGDEERQQAGAQSLPVGHRSSSVRSPNQALSSSAWNRRHGCCIPWYQGEIINHLSRVCPIHLKEWIGLVLTFITVGTSVTSMHAKKRNVNK